MAFLRFEGRPCAAVGGTRTLKLRGQSSKARNAVAYTHVANARMQELEIRSAPNLCVRDSAWAFVVRALGASDPART
jgi:hypothetical protein